MNNNSTESPDYFFKILVLGDSNVGKSCFILRFVDNTFADRHVSTLGINKI